MKLILFLFRSSKGMVTLATLAGIISGAASTILLALMSVVLVHPEDQPRWLVWAFVALCAVVPLTRFLSEVLLIHLGQKATFELRMHLSERILSLPLRHLEEIGAHLLLTALIDDVLAISNALATIPILCINLAVAAGCLAYLGWLSWSLLLILLGFIAVGVATYQIPMVKGIHQLRLARQEEDALFKHFRAMTDGAKELKLHRQRRTAFLTELLQSTATAFRKKVVLGLTIFTAAGSWGQILFFIFIGILLFLVPKVQTVSGQALVSYTLVLLYMMTPLQVILNSLPGLGRANIAFQKVRQLGISLDARPKELAPVAEWADAPPWNRLELAGVTQAYHREGEDSPFTLGPIDLTIERGKMLFLVGGNGSGKTTLAKLITGLYVPESGEIRLDGQPITDDNRDEYRQKFAVVFSDFYLFESLLGLTGGELDLRAREYLRQLQLDHKVKVENGTLSTVALSQGQRKRLALLTAYLEDRPIYLFDEWAADQDPHFKEVFYYHLLPTLKAQGKTVIVISHDDRYYSVADRIIKLDYGKLEYDKSLSQPRTVTAEAPAV